MKLWWRVLVIKISHWEYWNSSIVYLPTLPYLLFLWIKSRSMFFFNAANPGIEYGGFLMESKWKIHNDAPHGFFPETILINPSDEIDAVINKIKGTFHFPCIAKPDVGSQGRGVAIIQNLQQLRSYHHQCPVAYLIQKKINYPMEAGIFYVRMTHEAKGRITGIVQKQFIHIRGNGKSSVLELLTENPRYVLQRSALKKIIGHDVMNSIVPDGELRTIIDIGNHARGAMFTDASTKITEQLTATIDTLCQQVKGFYFGRLDIRFTSWESLEQGKDFAVIELNGSGSEPTHIYDPNHSILYAWKEICKHWALMQKISSDNHKLGVPNLRWNDGLQMFHEHLALSKKLALFNPALDHDQIEERVSLSIA